MGAATPIYYTADMVRTLNARVPEHTPRYETVHGELLVMRNAPRPLHQRIVARLLLAIGNYLRPERIGEVLTSPSEITWHLEDVLVQPDVFVVPRDVSRAFDGGRDWDAADRLLLVVEVLSPSTARVDRFTKRRLYQEREVPYYWLVDADARLVELWTPDDAFPRVERARVVWHPTGAREPLAISLTELFADA